MSATAINKNWEFGAMNSPATKSAPSASQPSKQEDYLRGLQDGMVAERRMRKDKFMRTIKTGMSESHTHTQEVFKFLRSLKFKPKAARLRIIDPERYEVLIVLPTAQFISTKMRAVYSHLFALKQAWNSDKYEINFRFTSASGRRAQAHMACDGFELSFIEDAPKGSGK